MLQERITSTKTGSITSFQAVYVPADDLTDPSPGDDLRAPRRDARAVAPDRGARHLSGGGSARLDEPPARSERRRPGALRHGARRAGRVAALQGAAGHHRDSRHGRAVGGRQAHRDARAQDSALPVAAVQRGARRSRARRASTCRSRIRSAASRASSPASTTCLPEQAFYMVGTIEDASREGEEAARRGRRRMASIHVDIVSAEGAIFSGDADMVFAPAKMGDVGIAPRHAPLLTELARRRARADSRAARSCLLRDGRRARGAAASRDRARRHRAARADSSTRPRRSRRGARAEVLEGKRGTIDYARAQAELAEAVARCARSSSCAKAKG